MSVSKKSAVCFNINIDSFVFQFSKHCGVFKQFYYEMSAFFFHPENGAFCIAFIIELFCDCVVGFCFLAGIGFSFQIIILIFFFQI